MNNRNQKRFAESILVLKNVFSGLFPVITIIAYTNLLSPFAALAWGYVIATILFATIITIKKEWRVNILNKKALKDILMAVIIIAIGFHGLYFLSLQFTSAQNVSLLSLMEIVFSFLIIGFITKKEPISKKHIFGAFLMLCSAIIILFRNSTAFNIGDLLILGAVALAPIGNIFAKRALYQVSLSYLLFMRSLIGAIVFFIASYFFEESLSIEVLIKSVPYLLFSGLVFLGVMKIITMFGFKKTSVTHTISFASLKPVFAFIFAWILLKETPTNIQIIATIPSFIGLYILATAQQKHTEYGFEKTKNT